MVTSPTAIIERLSEHYAENVDLIEPIRRGLCDIIHAEKDGVFLRFHGEDIYAVEGFQGRLFEICKEASGKDLVVRGTAAAAEARRTLGFPSANPCVQFCYRKQTPLPLEPHLDIRPLGVEYAEILHRHYRLVDDLSYLETLCKTGVMHGAFSEQGVLMGFVGMHAEGAIGLLEVFPEYRRRGVGRALECFEANLCLSHGNTPFTQVFCENTHSIALQKSLGFTAADTPIIWLYNS